MDGDLPMIALHLPSSHAATAAVTKQSRAREIIARPRCARREHAQRCRLREPHSNNNHRGSERTIEPLTVLCILLAAQGLVGSVQYELALPPDIVWVHVALATATWLALLWSIAAAGSLVPRRIAVPAHERRRPVQELEVAGPVR
jgi:heme A synthase